MNEEKRSNKNDSNCDRGYYGVVDDDDIDGLIEDYEKEEKHFNWKRKDKK